MSICSKSASVRTIFFLTGDVVGSVTTTGPGTLDLAVILDASFEPVNIANAFQVPDLDGDGNVGTVMDEALSKISELAASLGDSDRLSLIPSGLGGDSDPATVVSFSAQDLKQAVATDAASGGVSAQQALFNPITASYDSIDVTLDLAAALEAARDVFVAGPGFDQRKVVTIVATDGAIEDQSGETVFFDIPGTVPPRDVAGAVAALTDPSIGADVDVLVIPNNEFANDGILATVDFLEGVDSDGVVDVDDTAMFGLNELLDPRPTVASDADVISFSASIDRTPLADIDLDDLTADPAGFSFAASDLPVGVFDATIGLDTDGDGSVDLFRSLSETLAPDERMITDNRPFEFVLDGFVDDTTISVL